MTKENFAVAQKTLFVVHPQSDLDIDITYWKTKKTIKSHMSIPKVTPDEVHFSTKPIDVKRTWKNYYSQNNTTVNPYQD